MANYPFDRILGADNIVRDASTTTANLSLVDHTDKNFKQILSTAPVATEIPQIRSALTGVVTPYHGTIQSRPQVGNMAMYRKTKMAPITESVNAVIHLLMLLVHGTE